MFNKNFIDDCVNGNAQLLDLDKYVDYWHTYETNITLREFLGLTENEYALWGKSDDSIFGEFIKSRAVITQRLFVDMDGTLAIFSPVDRLETLYEKGYFLNLQPLDNVVLAVKDIIQNNPDIEVYILSAHLSDSLYALEEKNQWLDKYLPEIDVQHRIFPPCGTDKKEYIPNGIRSTDCLLDDYTHNLTLWQPPARGVKLLNGINHTKGTWKHDCISFDLGPKELVAQLTGIIQGMEKPLDQPKQYLSAEKMTVDQFAQEIQQQLEVVAEDAKSFAELLKAKLLMPNMKSEGIIAIKMQRPDAQHVASAQHWRKLGYRIKPGEFSKAIKVLTSYKEQSFVIDGKTIPTSQASAAERQQILTGELPVQEIIKTKMQLVYDVTQTDCPPAEYAMLNRLELQNLGVEQRYELMRSLMMDKGVNCISDKAMTILDATGYYDPDKNEIHIADRLKDYQKLSTLCDCCAACIVSSTTVQSEPVETFEAAYLALQFKQIVGVTINEAHFNRVAELYMQIPDRQDKMLDEALTRCQRANEYVSNDLQEMYRGFMQAQGMDLSMLSTQVAQNFIQDLG